MDKVKEAFFYIYLFVVVIVLLFAVTHSVKIEIALNCAEDGEFIFRDTVYTCGIRGE